MSLLLGAVGGKLSKHRHAGARMIRIVLASILGLTAMNVHAEAPRTALVIHAGAG